MKRLEHNPVFTSLLNEAKNYEDNLYEQSEEKINVQEASKYVRMIIGEWASNTVKFAQESPSSDLKEKIYPSTMEAIQKLGNNASIDDLVEGLKSIWKDITGKVNSFGRSDIKKVYDDASKGFDKLQEAYDIYKKKAGNLTTNADILKSVNDGMSDYVKNAQEAIKLAIRTTK